MAIKGKKEKRARRIKVKLRIRKQLRGSAERPRLCVFRSGRHTYAQVVEDDGGRTMVSASTLEADAKQEIETLASRLAQESAGKKEKGAGAAPAKSSQSSIAAQAVGFLLARRAVEKGIKRVVFDRGGFIYHGRVRALAEGARKGGLEF